MNIDIFTGYLFYFLFGLMLCLMNFLVAFITRVSRYFRLWSLAFFFWVITLGGVLLEFRGLELLTQLVIHPASAAYLVLSVVVANQIAGKKVVLLPYGIVFIIYVLVAYYWVLIQPNYQLRAGFTSLVHGASFGYLFYRVVDNVYKSNGFRILAIAVALESVFWFVRGGASLFINSSQGLSAIGVFNLIFLLSIPQVSVAVCIGFILVENERRYKQIQSISSRLLLVESEAVNSRLLANLNHELNTSLGTAKLANSLILEGDICTPEIAEAAEISGRAIEVCQQILTDRNEILNTQYNDITPYDTDALFLLFSRILKRNISTSAIAFTNKVPNKRISLSLKYVFTIMLTLFEIFQETGKDGDEDISFILTGLEEERKQLTFEFAYHGPFFLPKEALPFVGKNSDQILEDQKIIENKRFLWLVYYITQKFHGELRVDYGSSGLVLILSLESAQKLMDKNKNPLI